MDAKRRDEFVVLGRNDTGRLGEAPHEALTSVVAGFAQSLDCARRNALLFGNVGV